MILTAFDTRVKHLHSNPVLHVTNNNPSYQPTTTRRRIRNRYVQWLLTHVLTIDNYLYPPYHCCRCCRRCSRRRHSRRRCSIRSLRNQLISLVLPLTFVTIPIDPWHHGTHWLCYATSRRSNRSQHYHRLSICCPFSSSSSSSSSFCCIPSDGCVVWYERVRRDPRLGPHRDIVVIFPMQYHDYFVYPQPVRDICPIRMNKFLMNYSNNLTPRTITRVHFRVPHHRRRQ